MENLFDGFDWKKYAEEDQVEHKAHFRFMASYRFSCFRIPYKTMSFSTKFWDFIRRDIGVIVLESETAKVEIINFGDFTEHELLKYGDYIIVNLNSKGEYLAIIDRKGMPKSFWKNRETKEEERQMASLALYRRSTNPIYGLYDMSGDDSSLIPGMD